MFRSRTSKDADLEQDAPRDVALSEDEWRSRLTPEQYRVLRKAGTEPAFTGKYFDCHTRRHVPLCGLLVRSCSPRTPSSTRGRAGRASPSPTVARAVELHRDRSLGMARTEVVCRACGSHLGHVFDDGPRPTGQRYCINSCSLDLDAHPPRRPEPDGRAGDHRLRHTVVRGLQEGQAVLRASSGCTTASSTWTPTTPGSPSSSRSTTASG